MAKGGYDFPVLITTAPGLEIILNQFKVQDTDLVFRPLLKVDWATLPTKFCPLDLDSEPWEFAECIIPVILQEMRKGSPRVLASELAEHMIPLWEMMRPDYKKEMVKRIDAVVERASKLEFNAQLRRNKAIKHKTGTPTWDILDNPLSASPDKKGKVWKDMLRKQNDLITSLRSGQQLLPGILD